MSGSILDWAASVHPYAEAKAKGERIELRLASGTRAEARFTVPVEGVLRVRVAESLGPPRSSPMLVDLEETAARLRPDGDTIHVEGPGVAAEWGTRGLRMDAYQRAHPSIAAAGHLVGPDGPVGWVETAWLTADAAVYGGGESFQGPNLRGRVRRLVNSETHGASGLDVAYLNAPFFWSDAGWGLFFHSPAPVRADLGATHSEAAAVAVEGDELDLFVITGDAPGILRRYLALTGMPGAFPEWALGVWMSRCSYLSSGEIEAMLDELRGADCPVDVVHVDAWVEGNVIRDLTCNWTIDRARFPDGWTRDLGPRVSLWHNPYVLEGTPLARELEAKELLVRNPDGTLARTNDKADRLLVDFTNPEAEAWWRGAVQRVAAAEGASSFKPDFAEEVPEGALFADGRGGRALRNEYALRYQRATHEALRELWASDEIALFCRSGTSGSQRYPCHWVGDTPSTWTGLVTALRACLSLSLSGFGFVAHDVGGFWTPESFALVEKAFDVMDPSGIVADVDPELFARWAQWGALSPVMRFHGTGRREPTAYPEPARSVAVEACRLRRALRPYLVRAARAATAEGVPMMRPMPLAFPGDRGARDADLQYLLGHDILVAPVLEPGGRRRLYVPPGRWLGLVGLEPLEGPGWAEVECALDAFPAFVREGAPWPVSALRAPSLAADPLIG